MLESLLRYEFLQNSFLTGIIIGVIAPLLGVFLVFRKQALIADALSHVTLAGISGGILLSSWLPFFAGFNPLYGGLLFSIGGALLIEKLRTFYKHYEELAIPIIMSFGVGLAVVLISLASGTNVDMFIGYLFGSISAVSREDLYVVIGISILVLIIIFSIFKELFTLSFDEEYGKAQGLPAKKIHFAFIITVALTIAISMRIVGILLVSSLMTLPVAASIRIAKSFKQSVIYAVLFGEISVIGGLVIAFYLNLAPGGTIVMLAVFILFIAILKNKFQSKKEAIEVKG